MLDPEIRGPGGHAHECWEWDNGWPMLQCTQFLRPLPTSDGFGVIWSHLGACRSWPTTDEVRRARTTLGPDALPQLPPRPMAPDTMQAGPSPIAWRGSLAICGDVEPNPRPTHTEEGGSPGHVLPLDVSLTAPCIRGYFTLQPD